MKSYVLATLGAVAPAAVAIGATTRPISVNKIPLPAKSKCVQITSAGSFSCKDQGNFDSTCATAKCPSGYTLTGGGGACQAGDRRIKSLVPKLATGEFTIACEQQGVAPAAVAICCQL
jgi:hypothetical protein